MIILKDLILHFCLILSAYCEFNTHSLLIYFIYIIICAKVLYNVYNFGPELHQLWKNSQITPLQLSEFILHTITKFPLNSKPTQLSFTQLKKNETVQKALRHLNAGIYFYNFIAGAFVALQFAFLFVWYKSISASEQNNEFLSLFVLLIVSSTIFSITYDHFLNKIHLFTTLPVIILNNLFDYVCIWKVLATSKLNHTYYMSGFIGFTYICFTLVVLVILFKHLIKSQQISSIIDDQAILKMLTPFLGMALAIIIHFGIWNNQNQISIFRQYIITYDLILVFTCVLFQSLIKRLFRLNKQATQGIQQPLINRQPINDDPKQTDQQTQSTKIFGYHPNATIKHQSNVSSSMAPQIQNRNKQIYYPPIKQQIVQQQNQLPPRNELLATQSDFGYEYRRINSLSINEE